MQDQKQTHIDGDWIYDIETYPNCFTISLIRADGKLPRVFEISDRKNDIESILTCFRWLRDNNCRMVGFNNLGFDYPIIHEIMKVASKEKDKNYSKDKVFEFFESWTPDALNAKKYDWLN